MVLTKVSRLLSKCTRTPWEKLSVRTRNRNISLTKGWVMDIISPLGCNNLVERRMYACGAYSGANLYYYLLYQMTVVRSGLGVLVGGCLGAVCLSDGMAGVVKQLLEDSCFRILFSLLAMMPNSLVCASEQSLLRRVFAILLSWRRACRASCVLCICLGRRWWGGL
jgi:hypothetical protein